MDLTPLSAVINKLAEKEQLDTKHRDRELTGKLKGFRECHVRPDRLLIYRTNDNELMLFLLRTGTHSDLFG